jgi:hypothetical protein
VGEVAEAVRESLQWILGPTPQGEVSGTSKF